MSTLRPSAHIPPGTSSFPEWRSAPYLQGLGVCHPQECSALGTQRASSGTTDQGEWVGVRVTTYSWPTGTGFEGLGEGASNTRSSRRGGGDVLDAPLKPGPWCPPCSTSTKPRTPARPQHRATGLVVGPRRPMALDLCFGSTSPTAVPAQRRGRTAPQGLSAPPEPLPYTLASDAPARVGPSPSTPAPMHVPTGAQTKTASVDVVY